MRDGCPLTLQNIVAAADRDAEGIVDVIQDIIDDPAYDVPKRAVTKEDVARLQELYAYYTNWYPTLIGFWGKMRIAAERQARRIAVRDYLEKAASSCKQKYEAASRVLTAYQEMHQGDRDQRRF